MCNAADAVPCPAISRISRGEQDSNRSAKRKDIPPQAEMSLNPFLRDLPFTRLLRRVMLRLVRRLLLHKIAPGILALRSPQPETP